jgi:hypothetical protein
MPQPRAIVPDQGGIRPGLNSTGSTIPKYRIVKKATTAVDTITPAVNGTALPDGVTMQEILDGYAGDVQHKGRALVEAGAPITIGQKVTGGTGGKGAVATAAQFFIGEAASAAAADGDIIEVDIVPGVLPA